MEVLIGKEDPPGSELVGPCAERCELDFTTPLELLMATVLSAQSFPVAEVSDPHPTRRRVCPISGVTGIWRSSCSSG